MIFPETLLYVLDNSGARTAKCIKILNNRFPGSIADYAIVAIKRYNPKKKIKASELHLSVIIKSKFKFARKTGQFFKCSTNGIVLLKQDGYLPIGNRLQTFFLFNEIRKKGLTKLVSLTYDIK